MVINFTKTLAKDLAPNISVNTVAPGLTFTEYWNQFNQETLDHKVKKVPIKRFIKPTEVAQVCITLSENDAITDELIIIDGGFSLKDYN